MTPTDVRNALHGIGARYLHHANTVTTSCTFLASGGLLSRDYVESNGLAQTPQSSDEIDKRFEIWDRLFVDHVDIHERGGRVRGPNVYGPVLFLLDLDLLLNLPNGSDVLVTKSNPVYWRDGQPDGDRYYLTPAELTAHLTFGDFDKMLVITTPTGRIDFPGTPVLIQIDDPQRAMSDGSDAYTHAVARLGAAAAVGGVTITSGRHACRYDCTCVASYRGYDANRFDSRFS